MTGLALTPYLTCRDAASAIDFYGRAFDAREVFRLTDPADGRVGHAELRIGAARVMLADEYPDFGALSPDALGGSPVLLHLECDDVDALTAQATRAGAMLLRAPATQSFGERNAIVQDPFGHRWMLTRTVEVVAPEDMQRRWDEGAG